MPIIAQPFLGLPGGMNTALPSHELPPTQARYMQDIILHRPGMIQRRGLLAKVAGSATIPFRATGLAMTQDQSGNFIFAGIAGNAANANLYFWNAALTATTTYALPGTITFDPAAPRSIVDAKTSLGGGTWIGIADKYVNAGALNLYYWRGLTGADVSTTAAGAWVYGATTLTVASGVGLKAGHFLFDSTSNFWVGVVKSVVGTTVTLETGAWRPSNGAADSLVFKTVRPFIPRFGNGRITCTTGSSTVLGTSGPSGTKFSSQFASNSYALFRLSDDAYIGAVGGIGSDHNVTLTTNAAVNMTDERYYAVYPQGNLVDWSLGDGTAVHVITKNPGFLSAVWGGRQWFANKPYAVADRDYSTRLWFSDTAHPEMVDFSSDGGWIAVHSSTGINSPITAIASTAGGLAVFKDEELFVVRGTDPSNFSIQKIADVGVLYGGAVVPWNNGVLWPSDSSIYYFDGAHLRDMTPQLGEWWKEAVKNFTATTDRMGAFEYKDHYILYIDNFQSNIPVQSSTTNTWSKLTIVVNLTTGAVTTWANVAIKAAVMPPASAGKTPLFLVDDGGTPGTTSLIDSQALFQTNLSGTADAINCGGWTGTFPDFYFETGKFTLGEPERKKMFKQLAMTYIANGGTLSIATVPGLNDVGTVSASTYPAQTTFANKRIKFLKRDTAMGFRLFGTAANLVDVQIGPFEIGYKWMRTGRV